MRVKTRRFKIASPLKTTCWEGCFLPYAGGAPGEQVGQAGSTRSSASNRAGALHPDDYWQLNAFTPDTAVVSPQVANLRKGDSGGEILDSSAFAVEQLRLIGDTNTAMYSVAFPRTSAALSQEASRFNRRGQEPGAELSRGRPPFVARNMK